MKRFMSRVCLLLTCIVFLGAPSVVLADGVCANMKISHVGVSSASPSGVNMFLINESGAACGTIAADASVQFNLSTDNTDRALALILTAASLKKRIWTYYVGTSAPYTLAFVTVEDIVE